MSIDTVLSAVNALGAVAVPVVLAVVAHRLQRRASERDERTARLRQLAEVRTEHFRVIAPELNDLFAYFCFIGGWKSWSPPAIIEKKRSLDRAFFSVAPLFSPEARSAYATFMDACFETWGPWGADARLRTSPERHQQVWGGKWDTAWNAMFSPSARRGVSEQDLAGVRKAYDLLLGRLATDIRLEPQDAYVGAEVERNATVVDLSHLERLSRTNRNESRTS
ncbi:hypothetical protein [Kineococcus sp. SYSU DK005]|uniref:hypothetical protein n=1 Tax=Kineococcus sp. SYSU DK005 TaxID=3383126 RepID=UPI003D7E1FD3